MLKRLLTRFALWVLDGQYVPVSWLTQARRERDEESASWARRYDSEIGFLQERNREFLSRALRAEASIAELSRNYTENVQMPVHNIDIRVPRKVLR